MSVKYNGHRKTLLMHCSLTNISVFITLEKEKYTNKGTNKQYIVGSSIHSTTCHIW